MSVDLHIIWPVALLLWCSHRFCLPLRILPNIKVYLDVVSRGLSNLRCHFPRTAEQTDICQLSSMAFSKRISKSISVFQSLSVWVRELVFSLLNYWLTASTFSPIKPHGRESTYLYFVRSQRLLRLYAIWVKTRKDILHDFHVESNRVSILLPLNVAE